MNTQEWLKQADYDFETAEFMFTGGRYIYAVFMCHLAIEKILKGLYYKKFEQIPPKTHSLIHLTTKSELKPPEGIGKFLVRLDQASIVTRYPEDLSRIQGDYPQSIVKDILNKTKETLIWAKGMY